MSNRTSGSWHEYDSEAVRAEILRRAGVAKLTPIENVAKQARNAFEEGRDELLPAIDAVLAVHKDAALREARKKVADMDSHFSRSDVVRAMMPSQVMSRDSLAASAGIQVAPHIELQAWLIEQMSYKQQLEELGRKAKYFAKYLERKDRLGEPLVAKRGHRIFIGHGRSRAWRDLKDFVQERLHLPWDEFNREPVPGMSNKERLANMLDEAGFAFIVMTAEDEHADKTKHARANVVHEAGLFQGRLGFERAIIILEDGCEEFTNIEGLGQIRFPAGNITAAFEEVRRVLEREGILKG
jgi:predicted nucleotide-binding protein